MYLKREFTFNWTKHASIKIGLPDLGDVDSVPRIALTPNLRNGTGLTGLTVPDDVTGVVCMFSGKVCENVVGQVNGGIPCLASKAWFLSLSKFSTRKDAEVVTIGGCGTSCPFLNKLWYNGDGANIFGNILNSVDVNKKSFL